MLILTELDAAGRIVMDHGVAKSLHSVEEFWDKIPGQSMSRLKSIMHVALLERPNANLAIVKIDYRILYRNREPQQPCGE